MRVVAVSDLHNYYNSVTMPKGDLLIIAGDVSSRGNIEEVENFKRWFKAQDYAHKCFIAGNHDRYFQRKDKERVAEFFELGPNEHYLCDDGVTIDGVKIYGSPWTGIFLNWYFMANEPTLEQIWSKIPEGTDILITHGPPLGILDANSFGYSCGSISLLDRVMSMKNLKAHIFGHIHEGYGILEESGKTFINASTCTLQYKPINKPVVFDYVDGIITIIEGGRE